MSSRLGLWLRISRSVSPRVPTVEYARSERSWAKSSQAARNSALSAARSSAPRRRQAGSTLKNVNLTNVRSATARRVMAAALAAGAVACVAAPPARADVTVAIVPTTTVAELTGLGLSPAILSAGIGEVSTEQTLEDISAGERESPPSDAIPGLLESTLNAAHMGAAYRQVRVPVSELEPLVGGLRDDD